MGLKVYQGSLDGRNSFCIAASSWKAAHGAINQVDAVSLYYLRSMWGVTGNDEQIAAALSEPGVLFGRVERHPFGPYRPLRTVDDVRALAAEWRART